MEERSQARSDEDLVFVALRKNLVSRGTQFSFPEVHHQNLVATYVAHSSVVRLHLYESEDKRPK